MPTPPTSRQAASLNLAAGIAAILLPGLGQAIRGEIKRGILAAIGVLGLFFGGILIGGIDVIDSREDRVWFFGQALVGPIAFGIDTVHQTQFKAHDPNNARAGQNPRSGYPDEKRVYDDQTNRWIWQPLTREELDAGVQGPPNTRSVAKINEIGTLYATIAGMLNLIIILDALIITPFRKEETGETEHASDRPENTPAEGGHA